MSLKPTETWITRARIHARREDIGKEGAHLVPSSVHQHLNLRLACEVFAFGTLVRRLKKGQHCSPRDGVFYRATKKLREQQQVTFLTHWDLSCPSPAFVFYCSVLYSAPNSLLKLKERRSFGDEIYGAVEKRERRTWPRLIKLFCGENWGWGCGAGQATRDNLRLLFVPFWS